MSRQFLESQVGRTLRGLSVDDGRTIVTGNYLKLRLDQRQPRNEWVQVRVEPGRQAAVTGVQ